MNRTGTDDIAAFDEQHNRGTQHAYPWLTCGIKTSTSSSLGLTQQTVPMRVRRALLGQLLAKARGNRLRVDKAAFAYHEAGGIKFFGTPDLVKYLASRGVPQWTHTLDV